MRAYLPRLHFPFTAVRPLLFDGEIHLLPVRRKNVFIFSHQNLYSLTGAWPALAESRTHSVSGKLGEDSAASSDFYSHKKEIERTWTARIQAQDLADADAARNCLHNSTLSKQKPADLKYVLSMFPYPSGRLHLGHVRVYAISDTMTRYYRLNGNRVFHPMGWDAFGLPAENASLERGVPAAQWTADNIAQMEVQLKAFNFNFDWSVSLRTCDPEYYKWTQLIFLKLFDAGLVYQKSAWVNWDPVDRTVLANEQIDADGHSWRSGALVEPRLMRQWFVRTTHYSQQLLEGLAEVEPQWRDEIVGVQRNWLGRCDGRKVYFLLAGQRSSVKTTQLDVFTRKVEGIYGAAFLALKPSHVFVHELCDAGAVKRLDIDAALRPEKKPEVSRKKPTTPWSVKHFPPQLSDSAANAYELPVRALNPMREEVQIPIFVVPEDSPLFDSPRPGDANLDAHLGIPSLDQDDMLFAQTHGIPARDILGSLGTRLTASGEFSSMLLEEARKAIGVTMERLNCASGLTSAEREDWLVSRQRFWGTPIPIIHCDVCRDAVPVPLDQLPVMLPSVDEAAVAGGKKTAQAATPESGGVSPLAYYEDFVRCECPLCGSPHARRETDTLDTFFDSSWYFLRYPDCHNTHAPFDVDVAHRVMPVDLYIGGREHALMHLYYARFMSHFLYRELKWLPRAEPFDNLLVQGFVMGKSYRGLNSGQYYRPEEVEEFQVGDISALEPAFARLAHQQQLQPTSVTKTNRAVQKVADSEHATQDIKNSNDPTNTVILHRVRGVDDGEPVLTQWEKMSKSRHNGIDPSEALDTYGIDSTRLYMLANISPRTHRNWDPTLFSGSLNFEKRLWRLIGNLIAFYAGRINNSGEKQDATAAGADASGSTAAAQRLRDARNYYVMGVTYQLEHYFALSTAIGKLQGLLGELKKEPIDVAVQTDEYERALGALIVMLYPFAPHYAAELWTGLCAARKQCQHLPALFEGEIWQQPWPKLDAEYEMKLVIQFGDEKLDTILVPYTEFCNLTHAEAFSRAFTSSALLTKYISKRKMLSEKVAVATDDGFVNGHKCTKLEVDGITSQFVMQSGNEARLTFFDKAALGKFQAELRQAKRERKAHKELRQDGQQNERTSNGKQRKVVAAPGASAAEESREQTAAKR